MKNALNALAVVLHLTLHEAVGAVGTHEAKVLRGMGGFYPARHNPRGLEKGFATNTAEEFAGKATVFLEGETA